MKIFDCIKFFNEYEILDLRFMTLYDHVDHFVIVEANKTHTGKPKGFNFEERIEYLQLLNGLRRKSRNKSHLTYLYKVSD